MRESHRRNDDRIFAWDDPPPTGHPGEDYGCRCLAEPTLQDAGEPRVKLVVAPALVYSAEIAAILARMYANLQKARRAAAIARGAETLLNKLPQEGDGSDQREEDTPEENEDSEESPSTESDTENENTEWEFGNHKSDAKWENQIKKRG